MSKNELAKEPLKEEVQHKNLLFLIAGFAMLLSGDLMWWEIRQTADEYDHQTASMVSIVRSRSEEKDLAEMEKYLNDLEKKLLEESEISE